MLTINNVGRMTDFNKTGLTLDMIADLTKLGLLRELHLMEDDIASGRGPVDRQAVVATNPLCADVRVHRNGVRIAVVGCRRHRQVRERNGLVKQVTRL